MSLFTSIQQTAHFLGHTFQETKDICLNREALVEYSGWEHVRERVLTLEACSKLGVHFETRRSKLYIFRDYTFNISPNGSNLSVEILPVTENPSSLRAGFIKETLRRGAILVSVLALVVFTFPIAGSILGGAYFYSSPLTSESIERGWNAGIKQVLEVNHRLDLGLPKEPADSHVTPQDVLKIGRSLIGYRHVSTEDHAVRNATGGVPDGCALHLSFCPAEGGRKAVFEDLDLKVAREENCKALILEYEAAITKFISSAVVSDVPGPNPTYGDFVASLDNTRFMVVKTQWNKMDEWDNGRLGRCPKESIKPEGVTLLPRIRREALGIGEAKSKRRIHNPFEGHLLASYLAAHYRRALLLYLREEFDPSKFNAL